MSAAKGTRSGPLPIRMGTTCRRVAALLANVTAAPAMAVTGLLHSVLPPLPYPTAPPIAPLENLPGLIPAVPEGLLPDFVLQLPATPLDELALPALPIPPNADRNTLAACSPTADLSQRMVVVIRNLLPNNQVQVFARDLDGSLCPAGIYSTGGVASVCGGPCAGQDQVIADRGYIFATSSGSAAGPLGDGSLSVFRVEQDRLVLTDVESTLGPDPRAVTRSPDGSLVYVVNAGLSISLLGPSIAVIPQTLQGFRFDAVNGNLTAIANGHRPALDAAGDAADIGFTGDGAHVVISNRRGLLGVTSGAEPDRIEVHTLGPEGVPVRSQIHDLDGETPYGFRIVGQDLYMSFGGASNFVPSQGGLGAYHIRPDGGLDVLTPFTSQMGSFSGWDTVVTRGTDRPYLYATSFQDSKIAQWTINEDGSLTLLDAAHASGNPNGNFDYQLGRGAAEMDSTDTGDETFLYLSHNPNAAPLGLPIVRLAAFRISPQGDLTRVRDWVAQGLPSSGFGIAAW